MILTIGKIFLFIKWPIAVLLAMVVFSAHAQKLKSAPWENDFGMQIQRVNFSLQESFSAVQRSISYEFFPTKSGVSGEQKKVYYHFQALNQEGVGAFQNIIVPLEGAKLTHLDYRIWQEGYVIYEAKENSVSQRIVDTLWNASRQFPVAYLMSFPEMEAPAVLEFYYQLEGVAIPYHLELTDYFPLQSSDLEVNILSADPLDYKTFGEIKDSAFKEYDYQIYQFQAQNTKAAQAYGGLSRFDSATPQVFFKWQDLVLRYDRDLKKDWGSVLAHHFYRGPIKYYSVFANSEADFLGRSIYWGSLSIPQRFYRYREEELQENLQLAKGYQTLKKVFLNPLVDLQKWTNELAERPEVTLEHGLTLLDQKIKAYIERELRALHQAPYEYVDYGVLAKFYLDFLEAKGAQTFYALAKPERRGPVFTDFFDVAQFSALAIAYQKKSSSDLSFKLVGPYLGDTYPVDSFPSDLAGGQWLVYTPQNDSIFTHNIPQLKQRQSGFQIREDWQLSFKYNWVRTQRSYYTQGLFENKMYQAYLQNDVALDALSFTAYQRSNNFLLGNKSIEQPLEQIRERRDSFAYLFPTHKLLMVKRVPTQAAYVQLPTSYAVIYQVQLKADDDFTPLLDSAWLEANNWSNVSLSLDSLSPKKYALELRISFSALARSPQAISRYLQLQALLQQGLGVTIVRKDDT